MGEMMPLFICTKCGCVDNTALCRYWELSYNKEKILCSKCDPKIGRWHGAFPRRKPKSGVKYINRE
jgi:hypothetical protein